MPVQRAKACTWVLLPRLLPPSEHLVKSDYLLDTGVQTALQKICLNNCCLILTPGFFYQPNCCWEADPGDKVLSLLIIITSYTESTFVHFSVDLEMGSANECLVFINIFNQSNVPCCIKITVH